MKMRLTSKERLMRIFQNKEVDRPALKMWAAGFYDPEKQLHPLYHQVSKKAEEVTDLVINAGYPFDMLAGMHMKDCCERFEKETGDPLWKDVYTILHTPKGDLQQVNRVSTVKAPGYYMEHFVKEPEDIEKLLSLPYTPFPIDLKGHDALEARIGDRGIVNNTFEHTGYMIQRMMGSELLAYFSVDYRDLLLELADVYSARLRAHVQAMIDAGVRGVFGYVGPELLIPPLLGPQDFEDFVFQYDKPICDMIHNSGSFVWMHCHGKVLNFLERFIEMGIDVLNPLEPPKNGDINLNEVVDRYGSRIGWEGNIEIQELIQSSPERVKTLIDECVAAGSKSGRFILCPSTGYMEDIHPSQSFIDNLMLYLDYGLEAVERCRK